MNAISSVKKEISSIRHNAWSNLGDNVILLFQALTGGIYISVLSNIIFSNASLNHDRLELLYFIHLISSVIAIAALASAFYVSWRNKNAKK